MTSFANRRFDDGTRRWLWAMSLFIRSDVWDSQVALGHDRSFVDCFAAAPPGGTPRIMAHPHIYVLERCATEAGLG